MFGRYSVYKNGVIYARAHLIVQQANRPLDAVVARSAAGRITPQLQNLVFLDHVLQFSEVMILHHTGELFAVSQSEEIELNVH